jgi:hypothetical protein
LLSSPLLTTNVRVCFSFSCLVFLKILYSATNKIFSRSFAFIQPRGLNIHSCLTQNLFHTWKICGSASLIHFSSFHTFRLCVDNAI